MGSIKLSLPRCVGAGERPVKRQNLRRSIFAEKNRRGFIPAVFVWLKSDRA